jgi:site-specific recombinase XerD
VKLETAAAFADYVAELELQDLTPDYLRATKQRLRWFQDWLEDRPISANAAKHFLAHMRETGRSHKTIKCYYAAIKPFLAYHHKDLKVKFRNQKHLPRYHPTDHIHQLLTAVTARTDRWANHKKQRDALIILTLAYTGLRRAELAHLTPNDVANDYIYVRSGKGDKDRAIPLAQDLAQPLAQYIDDHNIAPTASIFGIQPKHIYTIIRNYAKASGLDITPHAIRHYFATTLVEKGAPLSAIQQLLGHTTIATTAIYLDMIPTHLKTSVSLLSGNLQAPKEETCAPQHPREKTRDTTSATSTPTPDASPRPAPPSPAYP